MSVLGDTFPSSVLSIPIIVKHCVIVSMSALERYHAVPSSSARCVSSSNRKLTRAVWEPWGGIANNRFKVRKY